MPPWSIALHDSAITRFIEDHELTVRDIKTQPWLGSDVAWEWTTDGWLILLYPGTYYDGPAEAIVLHVLSTIARRACPWFEETGAEEFDRLTVGFLDERPALAQDVRENFARSIVSTDNAICSALDLSYLLRHGYIATTGVNRLAQYRSSRIAGYDSAVEFLASMAVLRADVAHVAASRLHEAILTNKWYEFLPVLDRIEECLANHRVLHSDSLAVFKALRPGYENDTLHEKIAVLRRNVLGPRDQTSIDYEIAISYAREDGNVAEAFAERLIRENFEVYFDRYNEAETWGKDLYAHLNEVYGKRSASCLMVISQRYAEKLWTNFEREAAVARAVEGNIDYILPVRIDDTEVPGLPSSRWMVDLRSRSLDDACELLIQRLRILREPPASGSSRT